jgi:hypothetical protein
MLCQIEGFSPQTREVFNLDEALDASLRQQQLCEFYQFFSWNSS